MYSFFTEQDLKKQAEGQIIREEQYKSKEEYDRREEDRMRSVQNFTQSLSSLISIPSSSTQVVISLHRQISFIIVKFPL